MRIRLFLTAVLLLSASPALAQWTNEPAGSTRHNKKGVTMIRRSLLFILLMVLATPSLSLAQWTNKPSGFTTVLECPFSTSPTNCGIWDIYNSAIVSSDGAAPVSPSGVVIGRMLSTAVNGGMQLVKNWPVSREQYVGLTWRSNTGFGGRPVGNKMFFMLGPEAGGVFLWGADALNSGCEQLIWGTNTLNYDNYHICSFSLICYPNVNPTAATMCRGNWYKIEVYFKSSTTATSRDGIWRWWVNGVLVGNYTNANWNPQGGNEWQWNNTWDSSGDLQNIPRASDWEHYLDHIVIAVSNGSVSIDNPPGPPGGVTGFTATPGGVQ